MKFISESIHYVYIISNFEYILTPVVDWMPTPL